MYMAAVGEIRGNWPAFQAVVAALDDAGIETLVNTGNCVGEHPWPQEVVGLLRTRSVPSVQGLLDRRTARMIRKSATLSRTRPADELAALQDTFDRLRPGDIEFLARLPRHRTLRIEGIDIFLCHGTPARQTDTLAPGDSPSKFQRAREEANAPLIIVGNPPEPYAHWETGTLFVNPGAVGLCPGARKEAVYALIDTESDPWRVRFERVAY